MQWNERVNAAIEELGLGPLEERLQGCGAYLVGGVARSLVSGREPDRDVDIAVETDLDPLLEGLELVDGTRRHERFGTATVPLPGGRHADLARTRTETYEAPGALPAVRPASIHDDLARRDFTVNAIAIALDPPHDILDPFSGAADLEAGTLRALHADSFLDDPTRAIRGARYCARLGLEPDEPTLALLERADLGSVSADRRRAELGRLAGEDLAPAGFALLRSWGVIDVPTEDLELIGAIDLAADTDDGLWSPEARAAAILLTAEGDHAVIRARELAAAGSVRPSEGVRLAAGGSEPILLVARAAGADWVEPYMRRWRHVRLEIGGEDMIAAGHRPGPAIGAGLDGALAMKLDGELEGGRDEELAAALRIAGEPI